MQTGSSTDPFTLSHSAHRPHRRPSTVLATKRTTVRAAFDGELATIATPCASLSTDARSERLFRALVPKTEAETESAAEASAMLRRTRRDNGTLDQTRSDL